MYYKMVIGLKPIFMYMLSKSACIFNLYIKGII